MLVLSRQRDETIMIGDDIAITVVDIRGDKVRLGITAPTKIAVHRKEVYEAIRAENQRAAAIQPDAHDLAALRSASATPSSRPIPVRPGISSAKTSRLAITGGHLSLTSQNGSSNGSPSPDSAAPPTTYVRQTGTAPTHPQHPPRRPMNPQ